MTHICLPFQHADRDDKHGHHSTPGPARDLHTAPSIYKAPNKYVLDARRNIGIWRQKHHILIESQTRGLGSEGVKEMGPRLWPGLPHKDARALTGGCRSPSGRELPGLLQPKPRLASPSPRSPRLATSSEVMLLCDLSGFWSPFYEGL